MRPGAAIAPRRRRGWVLFLGLLLAGCGDVDYYLHLARGQARILWRERPVAEVLADTTVAASVRQRLRWIDGVRRYARDLGLPADGHFTRYYDTGGQSIAWNVSASPPDRFEAYLWSFPFVGDLPYKGFFERRRARAERDRLRAAGYDAIARPVSAYSTLGILPDPILSTSLELADDDLAELILHELTHAAVYVEAHTDYNESVATYVGQQGALEFLAARHGLDSDPVRTARRRRAEARAFNRFMRQVTSRLDSLYRLGLARPQTLQRRRHLFAEAKEDYRRRRSEFGDGRYDGFLAWEVNNARLLSYRRYHRDLGRLEAVQRRRRGDLSAALRHFVACGETADPWTCLDERDPAHEPP